MQIDIPPVDAATFWGALISIVGAPFYWVYKKIKHIEANTVTKDEFDARLDLMERSNCERTSYIRADIAKVEHSVSILVQHLMKK